MNGLLTRFDAWARTSDLTPQDLARYRILYAALALLLLPDFAFLGDLPDSWFNPPPGPFALLDGFPPSWFFIGLEIALALSLSFLLVGWHTRVAGLTAAGVMLVGFGFTYSLGKIDHNILLVLVPLVFSFSAWGQATSLDAVRGGGREAGDRGTWVPRYFALLVGLALATSAVQKLFTGWLDPSSQATLGHMARNLLLQGRDAWLAEPFIGITWSPMWESVDWATVVVEGMVVLAVVNWRFFRASLAVVALFHVSVLLMLNIAFVANVIAYAAFVRWSTVPLPDLPRLSGARRWVPWMVPVLAALSVAGRPLVETAVPVVEAGVIFLGGGVGAYYLARTGREIVRERRSGRARRITPAV